jgi:hypothetical protein
MKSNMIVREGARRVDTSQQDNEESWDLIEDLFIAGLWVAAFVLLCMCLLVTAGYASAYWPRLVSFMGAL